jgi:hypothetical protein
VSEPWSIVISAILGAILKAEFFLPNARTREIWKTELPISTFVANEIVSAVLFVISPHRRPQATG